MGVKKTKEIAKNNLYWPGILSDVESYITSCSICVKYSKSKIKEPFINHEIPNIPFFKIGVDIADYAGSNYLIVYDYYSRWLEILNLRNKTSTCVIENPQHGPHNPHKGFLHLHF